MRATDETSGKLLVAAYQRMLGDQPEAALAYMAERVLAECRWFPTIAECFDILADWKRDDEPQQAKALARGIIEHRTIKDERESFERKEAFIVALRKGEVTQAEVDAAPIWFCDCAEALGLLTRDGRNYLLRTKVAA